jgi:nitroreductase
MPTRTDWTVGPDGRLGSALRQCLLAAIAAPSVHNTQPWRFRPYANGVDVHADLARRLETTDPHGRETLISVGAALLNLRIAIRASGRTPLTLLTPRPDEPDLVARVMFGPPAHPSTTVRMLAAAIPRRHSNRRPFDATPVPPEVLAELRAAAHAEGGRLSVADHAARTKVLDLVRLADTQQRRDAEYLRELAEWTEVVPKRCDGVPPATFGPWSALQTLPLRDFGLVDPARHRDVVRFEAEPTIAVLYSASETRRAWIESGQALERVLLTATVRGLATTLMTQPMEIPQLRAQLADRASSLIPQAIMRIGYGPPAAATPRRGLGDVVINTRSPGATRSCRAR